MCRRYLSPHRHHVMGFCWLRRMDQNREAQDGCHCPRSHSWDLSPGQGDPRALVCPLWCTVSHPRPTRESGGPAELSEEEVVLAQARRLFRPSQGLRGGCFPLFPFGQPHPEASARRPQAGPSRLPHPCSVLHPPPGGMGPRLPISSDGFTSASEPANIFSLSTPQFLEFKPHHMLWPRGLGEVAEALPWVDCFPTINFALPSQAFL